MRAIRRVTQRAPTAPTRGGWKAWGPLCRWPIGKLGGEVVHVRKIADVVDISKWRCWWRGSGRGLFPEAAVREDLLDEVGLRGLVGPATGASLNPARSFGPALVGGVWENQGLYCVAPILGAVLAALAYQAMFGSRAEQG